MNIPQVINTFDTTAQDSIAANSTNPSELFDIRIGYHPFIQKLAISTAENGALHVVDKVSGLSKDTIYGFTRINKNSLLLEDCKRVSGAAINVGDILSSTWGEYEVGKLEDVISSYVIRNVTGTILLSFDTDLSTLFNYDTSAAPGVLTLPVITEVKDGVYTAVKRNGVGFGLTLTPGAGDTVEGAASFMVAEGETITLAADYTNNNWVFVSDWTTKASLNTQIIDKSTTGALTTTEIESNLIVVDTSSGVVILTLPTSTPDTLKTTLKCKGGGLCTLTAGAGDTVESGATINLGSGQFSTVIYDATNTNWIEIG